MIKNKFKIFSALLFVVAMVMLTVIIFPILKAFGNPDEFKAYIDSFDNLGFLFLMLVQIFQIIVALIPGEIVEFLAGTVYGWFGGLMFCLLGVAIGQFIVFTAVRYFGKGLVERVAGSKMMKKMSFLQNEKKLKTIVFLLFFIPGTPKDLLTYFVPLTDIKLKDFLLLTLVARIPSIVTSTFAGDSFAESNFVLVIASYAVILVMFAIGYVWYGKWNEKKQKNNKESSDVDKEIEIK